jgi:hypothetical protein
LCGLGRALQLNGTSLGLRPVFRLLPAEAREMKVPIQVGQASRPCFAQ